MKKLLLCMALVLILTPALVSASLIDHLPELSLAHKKMLGKQKIVTLLDEVATGVKNGTLIKQPFDQEKSVYSAVAYHKELSVIYDSALHTAGAGRFDECDRALEDWLSRFSRNEPPFEVLPILIEAGADPNKQDANGLTPLHAVAQHAVTWDKEKGNDKLASYLIKRGALVNTETVDGYTALAYAIQRQNLGIINILLDSDALIRPQDKDGISTVRSALFQETALHRAVVNNPTVKKVKILLDAGANVNAQHVGGKVLPWVYVHKDKASVLHWALQVKNQNPEIIQLLLAAGARVRSDDSPLLCAIDNNQSLPVMDIFNHLRDSGVPVTSRALRTALSCNQFDLADSLMAQGIKLDPASNDDAQALNNVFYYDRERYYFHEKIQRFLDAGANPNLKCSLKSALYGQDERIDFKSIEILLNAGAKVVEDSITGFNLRCAMRCAIRTNNTELVRMVIRSAGALPASDETPLHMAVDGFTCRVANSEMFRFLHSEYNLDINAQNSLGDTVLHCIVVAILNEKEHDQDIKKIERRIAEMRDFPARREARFLEGGLIAHQKEIDNLVRVIKCRSECMRDAPESFLYLLDNGVEVNSKGLSRN